MTGGALRSEDFHAGERRSLGRQPQDKAIAVMPFTPSEGLHFRQARLTDCSTAGIGIWVDAPMKLGAQFMVKAALSQFVLIVYTVRHCQPDCGGYRIGASFSGLIGAAREHDPEAVLQSLLAA